MGDSLLVAAGLMSLAVAAFHIGAAFMPSWQRTFGAPQALIDAGPLTIGAASFALAALFGAWGAYGFSGAGLIAELPLLAAGLVTIAAVYTSRGLMLVPQLLARAGRLRREIPVDLPSLASSAVSLAIGLTYVAGTATSWSELV
jgi:hypothetical protein